MKTVEVNLPHHYIEHFLKVFNNTSFVQKVVLFGSRARGDHEEKSDIDLAIEISHENPKDWLDLLEALQQITLLKFDLVNWNEASPELKAKVEKEGKILYVR